jgi:hypothetical protein
MLSAPLAFGTTLETIPRADRYLQADGVGRKDARRAIGFAWSGSRTLVNDANRSIALATLAPLLEGDFDAVSLQRDVRETDRAALAASRLREFEGWGDFSDTARLIASLDLVITVDTSIAHLAGALGKPVWVLLPFSPDWRWLLDRGDSPWYPSARLFRQPAIGQWAPVIAAVADALAVLK